MKKNFPNEAARRIVRLALEEDLAEAGDVTSLSLFGPEERGSALVVPREDGVWAGLPILEIVFEELAARPGGHGRAEAELFSKDGEAAEARRGGARVFGPVRAILAAERTALNFIGHLSGVATLARRFVREVEGSGAQVLDTRKTTPGLRELEKYAVRCGGGVNHRMGLFDLAFLKDNHLAAAGSVEAAAARLRSALGASSPFVVEAESPEEARRAAEAGAAIVLLDNMTPEGMAEPVRLVAGRAATEASGGITLENVREAAGSGVDRISAGAITYDAGRLDVGLDWE